MTKTRSLLVIPIGLLILGAVLYTFATPDQQTGQIYPATINRDCAPWDGAAFTVKIPMHDGAVMNISIWQAPEIQFPKTFSFPDDTGQVGNISLSHAIGLPEQLSGTVSFSRVDQSTVVEGWFDLRDEKRNSFKGMFNAEWEDLIMLCG